MSGSAKWREMSPKSTHEATPLRRSLVLTILKIFLIFLVPTLCVGTHCFSALR